MNIPHYEAGLGDPTAALLTIIPETQQAELRGAAGDSLLEPLGPDGARPEQASFRIQPREAQLAEVTEWFCRIYFRMSAVSERTEGSYMRRDIVTATGGEMDRWRISQAATAFGRVLPRTNFVNGGHALRFGNLRIAERRATPEEVSAHEEHQREVAERQRAERQARRRATEVERPVQRDLTQHDHALITVADYGRSLCYSLPLNSSDAIFAARIIEAGSQLGGNTKKLSQVTWLALNLMSEAERSLLGERKRAGDFIVPLRDLVKGLLNPIGIASKEAGADKIAFTARAIDIEYHEAPPETPYDEDEITVLLPPGNASPETVREAHALLDLVYGPDAVTISQVDALRILDLIKQRDGKHALMAALRETPRNVTYASAEHYLTTVATHHLREGFEQADTNRTPGGNVYRRRPQQVSGRLPGGSTFCHIGFEAKKPTAAIRRRITSQRIAPKRNRNDESRTACDCAGPRLL